MIKPEEIVCLRVNDSPENKLDMQYIVNSKLNQSNIKHIAVDFNSIYRCYMELHGADTLAAIIRGLENLETVDMILWANYRNGFDEMMLLEEFALFLEAIAGLWTSLATGTRRSSPRIGCLILEKNATSVHCQIIKTIPRVYIGETPCGLKIVNALESGGLGVKM